MKVFVTGSSSRLAAALLPRLCAEPGIEQVTGIDLTPPAYHHPKFRASVGDFRSPELESMVDGHGCFIHFGFVVLRGRMPEQEMFDVNVTGSLKAFHAARRAGALRLIHLSTAAVYGSGVHLREDAPLEPLPGFLYAQHKVRLEQLLELEFPECVRLRPHVILGPNAQPVLRQLLNQPFYVRLPEPQPLLQCVHEDDVARAVCSALERNVRGAFNLATEDSFSFRDALRRRHRLTLPLSTSAAAALARLAWRFFGWGGEPAWVDGLAGTLLINCRRAALELNWRSSRSAIEILDQT
jgi:nucleoside-diphosphate-sugar epimerase